MSKLVLREPAQGRRGVPALPLEITRHPGNQTASIKNTETGEEILAIEVEAITRKVKVLVSANPSAVIAELTDGIKTSPLPGKATPQEKSSDRSWSNDGKVFRAWLPNGNAVEIPVAPAPGPYTPSEEVHEVLGQPELIFAVAFAILKGKHFLLSGPTGVAKTTIVRWLAKQLNYNLVIMPISRSTEAGHLVGEYLPVDEAGKFEWTYGPVSTAAKLSATHPTILLLDEINRIGNIQELARIYSLLDDTRMLEMKEKRNADGTIEMLKAGNLFVGATSNPSDAETADYIGVTELDPALNSRFSIQPRISYPAPEIEAKALESRVEGFGFNEALRMVEVANRIRQAEDVRFPISFRELEAWALALPYYGWKQAAEVAVVSKAGADYRPSIRDYIALKPRTQAAS
jgi:MoxR-like ATPase